MMLCWLCIIHVSYTSLLSVAIKLYFYVYCEVVAYRSREGVIIM